jgi:phage terminase large subunit-like protein
MPAALITPDHPEFLDYEAMLRAVPQLRFDRAAILAMDPVAAGRAKELIDTWNETLKVNPLLGYRPAGPKHWHFHMSDAKRRAIFGGNRSGKTTTAIADDLIQMCPVELLPKHLRQFKRHECPFYVRLMTPDMERTMKPVIHQKLREWIPQPLLKGGSFDKAYDRTAQALRLECGCRFDFLSYEMSIDKFGGAALHRCHYDEEPPEEIRNECTWRLVDFKGDELFSMTPLKGLSWTYRRIWKRRGELMKSGRKRVEAFQISVHENRVLSHEEIDEALGEIENQGEREQREHGRFSERGGMVLPTFGDTKVADVKPSDVRGLDFIVCIDPGVRWAGFCWIAFDSDNYALVVDSEELVGAGKPNGIVPADYVALCNERKKHWGFTRERRVIDPSARIRNLVNGETVQSVLTRMGLLTFPGQNDVEAGVMTIRQRIDAKSLHVCERNEKLFDQAVEYAQEDREDGKFEVIKKNDHILDAMRYGLMERPWLPKKKQAKIAPGADVASGPPRRRPRQSSSMGAMA